MRKLSFLLLVSLVGVVPACTQPATPRASAPFVDGARLKAVHYDIEGAPPFFLGWYDSELGFDCSFVNENLMDHPVCFPAETWQPPFANDTSLFTDSGCSEAVVGTDFPGETRYFVGGSEPAGFSCDPTPSRLFRVGDVVSSGTPLFLLEGLTSPGNCRPATAAEANGFRELRVLGPEIPADALVRGTLGHDAGPARIVPLTVAGSDGSMQGAITSDPWVLAWDNQRQEMVSLSTLSAPDRRWYPASSHDARYFSNAECSARAAVGVTCASMAKEASLTTIDACGLLTVANMFELGPPLDPETIYSGPGPTACPQIVGWPANDPSISAFSIGAPIPLTSFADAIELHTGTGRLQVIEQGSPGGPATAALGFFDSVRGEPCSVLVPAADDELRCFPGALNFSATLYFADEVCAVPLLSGVSPGSECAPAPTLAARDEWVGDTGRMRRHVYPIGEAYVGNVWFKVPGDPQCFDVGSGVGYGLFATGPEIPAASFPAVKHVRPN